MPAPDEGTVTAVVATADVDEVGVVGEQGAERCPIALVPRPLDLVERGGGDGGGHAALRSLRARRSPVATRKASEAAKPRSPRPKRGAWRRRRRWTLRPSRRRRAGRDVRAAADPHSVTLQFARSAFEHACVVCDWDPALPASARGTPPPVV
jgi:hypothetical protein